MTPEVKERIDQIRHGNVPEGYKRIKDALVPAEWSTCKISDFATISQGFTFRRDFQGNSNGNWNYFKVADIGLEANGKYLTKALNTISEEIMHQIGCVPFKAGSIVFPRVGAALLNNNKKLLAQDSIVDDNVLVLSVTNANVCVNEFIYYALQNLRLENWCNSGLVPVINSKTVYKHTLHLPSVREQQKIAEILTTQDKVIELKEKLLAEKQRQKKYLMQQLLTGKKQLHGFDGERKRVKLGNIAERIVLRNDEGNENILTISAQHGLISQSEFFKKEIASDDKSNYFLLHKDDFAYNKSYSTGYPLGATKRLNRYDKGIVSPLYICFRIVGSDASIGYIEQYFEAGLMNRKIQAFAQEGARNHGLLNIAVNDFFNMDVDLPSIEEQMGIVAILEKSDQEIELLRQNIEQEKQKKKALMQLLLTGIVRVKGE